MEKLKNCPNCGGYLNDNGRCEFCGSKIYDFVNVDFDDGSKTYIRVKYNGRVVLMPVRFTSYRYDISRFGIDTIPYVDDYRSTLYLRTPEISGTLDFYVVGDVITEVRDSD